MQKGAKINVENLKGLEKFITSTANPKFFFTMTEINKVGINPQSGYNTPLGVYAYPLDNEYYKKLLGKTLPFAGQKPYINLFTLNVPALNMTTYSEADLKRDTEKIKLIYNFKPKANPGEPGVFTQVNIDSAFAGSRQNTPMSKFWNLTRIMSNDTRNWNYLLRKLGYSNFYDPGTGLIYSSEPVQIVVLDPSTIITVESFYNPHVYMGDSLPHVPPSEKKMLEQRQEQANRLLTYLQTTTNTKWLEQVALKYIDNSSVIRAILDNTNVSADILRLIYKSSADKDQLIYRLAGNPKTPADLLDQMADLTVIESEDMVALVNHPNLSYQTLKKISQSPHSYFRAMVADSPKVTLEILRELSKDTATGVQEAVANSDYVTSEILSNMVTPITSPHVLERIAANGKTPATVLDKMAHDEASYGINMHVYVLEQIATNLETLPETLDFLAEYDYDHVNGSVARNKNTGPNTLDKLSRSKNIFIRDLVASHPHTSIETLNILAQDFSTRTRALARSALREREQEAVIAHSDINMTKQAKEYEKIPMSVVKKMPYQSLNRMIKKMREYLKHNQTVIEMFDKYDVDIEEIDYIPMMFGNIDVSAKTDHGIIIYNYRLLTDGDFFKDFSYGVHEMTHWLQQTAGKKATKSSDDGNYLQNPYEQEGFQNQVQYIADQFGESEAEKYVDDLLEHHEVDNKKERQEKKETLMAKV